MTDENLSRRSLLAGAAAVAGGALLEQVGVAPNSAQQPSSTVKVAADTTRAAAVVVPSDPTAAPGLPTSATSIRSPFELPERAPVGVISGSSMSPIHKLTGTITPADLVFERHHAGVALIDPARYKLLIHGLVERPMVFTLDDLHRFPSVSRIHFLECSGNGRAGYRSPKPETSPQQIDGLFANGEWTGVPLTTVLREVGVAPAAKWMLAEGGDAAKLSRSIPIGKALDDAMLAYAYNGEPLRPSSGYPVRLLLPGYEGNMNVKWLRRLELIAEPNMSKDETSKYTDALPGGKARMFSFDMDVKSTITWPAFPATLGARGWVPITGLAWSGRGKVTRVDVSTDGGASWTAAELQEPVLSKAATRFRLMWEWPGTEAVLMSRAWDETGASQPTQAVFRATRGAGTDYHYSYIRAWKILASGQVVCEANA
jgi:sulfane dehydrogenase subunit SoxC